MMRPCLHALQLRFVYVLGGLPQSALRRPNRITGPPTRWPASTVTSLDKSETWARNPPSLLYVLSPGYSLTPLPGVSWAFFCERRSVCHSRRSNPRARFSPDRGGRACRGGCPIARKGLGITNSTVQPYPRPAAVLVNELDANRFEGRAQKSFKFAFPPDRWFTLGSGLNAGGAARRRGATTRRS